MFQRVTQRMRWFEKQLKLEIVCAYNFLYRAVIIDVLSDARNAVQQKKVYSIMSSQMLLPLLLHQMRGQISLLCNVFRVIRVESFQLYGDAVKVIHL